MKILSWNCQGLGNPWTVTALRDRCWRDRPEIVFIMETMIDARRLERVRNSCGFTQGSCISSIGILWRDVNVVIKSYSAHHVDTEVRRQDNRVAWRVAGIYGWLERENKHLTWKLMERYWGNCTKPLVMFGDFNEILGPSEKDGGAIRGERQMDAFRGAIDGCNLRDMGF